LEVILYLIDVDTVKAIIAKILPIKIEFCYIYDNEKDSLYSIIPPSDERKCIRASEMDQFIHEISLAELMFSQHQKLVGPLQNIICNFFPNLQIASFPLQNSVLVVAFIKEKLPSYAENNLLFRRIEKLISRLSVQQ
jgi:hypothetical protein